MNKYLQILCDLLHRNYNEAVEFEARFQEQSEIKKLADLKKFIQELAEAGKWPKDNGIALQPKKVLEQYIDIDYMDKYDNIGLAIMLSRISARLERTEGEVQDAVS